MRLGILGGTFDPIHQGHLRLAETARLQYHLDKVLFIPALRPPHKTNKRDLTPAPYRYQMTELAVQNQPHFEVSRMEFDRRGISYTVDTLRALRKTHPGDEFFLILGEDSLTELPTWKDFGEIEKMSVILAARRPGLKAAAPAGSEIHWIDMPACGISSSEIRSRLASGKKLESGLLPEAVLGYVKKMHLYKKGKT